MIKHRKESYGTGYRVFCGDKVLVETHIENLQLPDTICSICGELVKIRALNRREPKCPRAMTS